MQAFTVDDDRRFAHQHIGYLADQLDDIERQRMEEPSEALDRKVAAIHARIMELWDVVNQ